MNALCYKTVFSKRLGALVAVGEHATSQSKGQGAGTVCGTWTLGSVLRYVGVLALGFAAVSLAWSQTLPQGGRVSQGQVTISQSGQQMAITQSTTKAVVNWDSFDIGANAKVNIAQPSSQSVLLNRVLSDNPTQILGQLQANGQVVLVNPKGIVVGSDGSVSASAFTASTLNISDADFMAGNGRYTREGSTGEVVNKGRINVAPGGYVALLGARVSNEGQIIAPQGSVALGAAETVSVPIGRTGKIKLELTPASINASVANQKGGVIVAEGGQVYMQAAALGQAVASVLHSGHIDTSGAQAGAVHLLADGGQIKVDGSITANSTNGTAGGDIYIGRDEDTNVLAAVGDVSGAQLESRGGFVETSGQYLVTTGTRVLAKDWLLDPYNISIAASGASGTAYSSAYTPGEDSVILASDIAANLNAGTNVTIETGLNGSAGTSDGNIVVNAAIVKSGSSDASLTLTANNGITVNQRIGRAAADTTSTGKLDVVMTANGDATDPLSSQGIAFNSVIDANGGQVTLTGTSKNTSGVQTGPTYTYGVTNNSRSGVVFNGGSGITADNYQVMGTHTVAAGDSFGVNGVYLNSAVTFKATANTDSNITGNSNAQGNFGAGVMVMDGATIRLENQGTGVTTLKGSNTNTGGGNGVRIGAGANSAVINAIGRVTLGQQTANVNAPIFVRSTINASQNSASQSGLSILGQTGLNTSAVQIWDTNINATGIDVVVDGITANAAGVYIQNGGNTTWTTKNLSVMGVANTTAGSSGTGVKVQRYSNVLTVNSSGNIAIQGTLQGAGTGRGIYFAESGWGAQAPRLIATGNINLRGNNRASATNGSEAVYIASGVQATAGGNLVLQGETNNAAANAIHLYSAATNYTSWNTAGASALQGNTTLQATGNVLVQSNQGSIWLNNQLSSTLNNGGTPLLTSDTKITGLNITLDNTGAGMTTGASNTVGSGSIDAQGFVIRGSGTSTASAAGIRLTDGRAITAKNSLNIFGASTIGSGVQISGAAALSAGDTGFTGNMFIRGENTSNVGAAINISNTASTLSASNLINLKSSGTGSGTSLVAAGGIQVGAELQVENPAIGTISGVISGTGLLRKIGGTGSGTLALTSTNTYTGGTVANGGTLQVGNGGTTGTLGVSGTVSIGAVLAFKRSDVVEVSHAITGVGRLWQTGTGTTMLTGNNTYTGSTVVNAGTLQVGNGGSTGTLGTGAVTLSNSANLNFVRSADTVIGNAISGAGNVSASITGAAGDLALNGAMALTGGTVNLAADGNLTVTQSIGTTNTGSAAVVLNAGKALSAGNASGGNIVFSGNGAVSVSGSGRATLFTGSVAGSTGLGIVEGNNRFNSDELSSGYTTALGSGLYAIYRENRSLSVTFSNAAKTYDGNAYTGGNGFTATGLVGNDTVALLGSAVYGGNAQGAVHAGTYEISGSSSGSADVTALGYSLAYNNGALTVNKANLSATGTKEYDAATTFAGSSFTSIAGVNGETFTATGSGTLANPNVQSAQTLQSLGTLSLVGVNGALASNYHWTTASTSVSVTPRTLTVTGANNTVTYNGATQTNTGATIAGNQGSDSFSISGYGSGTNASTTAYADNLLVTGTGTTQLSNYSIVYTHGGLTIGKANLTLSGTRVYDAGTTFAGQHLTASGVAGQTFSVTGLGDASNLASKNAQTNQTLSSVTGLSLGSSSNGGQSSNYNALSTTGSSVSVTSKALTLNAGPVSKTYDGSLSYSTSAADLTTLSAQLVSGDTVTAASLAFTDKNAGTGNKSISFNSATLEDGNNGGNYSLTLVGNNTSTIDKANITVALQGSVEKTYDGLDSATVNSAHFATSGWVSGEGASITQTAAVYANQNVSANPGNGTVSANLQLSDYAAQANTGLNNYSLATNASGAVGKINPAALNIKVNDTKMFVTQDANLAFDQGFSYTGLVNGESAADVLTGGAPGAGARSYTGAQFPGVGSLNGVYGLSTTPTALNGNYSVSVTPGNLQVIPADQLLVTISSQSDAYGQRKAPQAGVAASGTVTAQYCLVQSNCNGANLYTLNLTSGNGSTWQGTDNTGNTITLGTGLAGSPTYSSGGYLNAGNHTYALASLSSTVANQFNGHEVNGGVLTITPLQMSLNASDVTKVYDGNNSLLSATLSPSGTLSGDALQATFASGSFAGKNAGFQGFTLSGLALQGADQANYVLGSAQLSGTGTITPKAITASGLQAQDKVYDGNTQASVQTSGAVFNGIVAGDQLSVTATGQFDTRHVGTNKAVSLSSSFGGADLDNYSITPQASSTASITPAPLVVTASAARKTYDGNTTAPGVGTVGALAGAAAGDTVAFAGSLAFTNKNAGSGKTVTVTGVRLVDGSNTDVSGNYAITYINSQNGTIDRANASIAAQDNSTVYNGAVQSQSGISYSGFVAGDDVQATGLASGRNAGSYASSLSASGADVGNYNITFNNAALHIAKRPASLSALGQTVVYNGQTQSLNGTQGTGFVAGDALSFGGLPSGRNVGQYSSAMTVSGADAANYDITLGNATLTITPKSASVTARPERVTYNGQTQQQSAAVLEDFVAGDDIRVSGLASGRNVGVYGSNVLASGQDAGNYSITYQQGALTIDKAPLQFVGTSAADKVYDTNTQASVTAGTITGLMGSETLNINTVQGQFDNAEMGTAKPVQVVYGLSDGANGGLVANYQWSPVTVKASITGDTSVQAPSPEVIRNADPISRLSFLGFVGLVRMGATTGQLFYAIRPNDTRTCSPLQLEGCICEQPQGQSLEVCYPAEMAQQARKLH